MLVVDSHCHLNFPDFKEDFADVIARAKAANVGIMQTICTSYGEFEEVLAIARSYENMYCSIGVHPDEVANEDILKAETIIKHASDPKVIGIGETGIDLYRDKTHYNRQIESFTEHVKASRETGLPVIIHTRDADPETIEFLEREMKIGKFKGLIHCFSTSKELALKAIELGLYVSISGIVTFKNAKALQEIVSQLPIERLLIETDSPYLAPTPHRGKRNEPSYVVEVAGFIANLKGITYREVAEITTSNFLELFDKVQTS